MELSIQKLKITYDAKGKIFTSTSQGVMFGTKHTVVNDLTGKKVEFELSHSTGSEWEKDTIWVYTSICKKYILHLKNDDVTEQHKENYLRAKTRT